MRVSVIIPVRDDPRVYQCVESVLALAHEADVLQVLVIENGSTDAFRAGLRTLPAAVELLSERVAGAYQARNRGIDQAHGEAILFTDADCIVRPGWIRAAVERLEQGADLVQGYSGAVGQSRLDRLIQQRYEAHLRRTQPGDGTECDTRNLAVWRGVFERLRFDERYYRVGDTELGLVAESLGFRVVYCPEMRVDHAHERDLARFAAKQVCHGWGAQRLMQEHPEIRWHGGHLQIVGRLAGQLGTLRGAHSFGLILARAAILGGELTQALSERLPYPLSAAALTGVDKLAGLGGHLIYAPGGVEPSPSQLLKRPLARN
jgi:glycosyltransferase involved in cell wall biosynthesis